MTGTDQVAEQEIKHEQTVVDKVYARLDAATRSAQRLAADGHRRATLGNEGGLVERDAIVFQAAKRIATLDAAHEGLVFGRLDTGEGDTRYIGRIGLRDADRDVLLIDWRAPVAAVFYQATAAEPMNVVRRRVLRCTGERVVGVEDELLDASAAPDDIVIIGEGALLAALSQARDAHMHSIVATIQKEQDDAIRAPHKGVTTISGGPGTGKTVVALHRAAYLLYTDRRRYERGGVLIVGPSAIFMKYIDQVLPSLGETSVSLRALGDVVDGLHATRRDHPAVAAVKGSGRMGAVLARVARTATPDAPRELRIFYRDDVLRLDDRALRDVRRELLTKGLRRNQAAPKVADLLIDRLWEQVAGERALERSRDEFTATMLGDRQFTEFVAAWWPIVDAVDVFGWLRDPRLLRNLAGELLSRPEIDDFVESLSIDDVSVEDVPLIDELRYLLGDAPAPEEDEFDPVADLDDPLVPELSAGYERVATGSGSGAPTGSVEDDGYAHVLVDEAQDLSPMQWRMLGRRGRVASWTIVGDAAQSSWPHPGEAQAARTAALGAAEQRTFRLSTNYRNSAEIFELAAEVAAAIPDADLPRAIRRTGIEPVIAAATELSLPDRTRQSVAGIVSAVDGTVAVVAPAGWSERVRGWLDGRVDLDQRVLVLDPLETKGLEFDAVVVVEPDLIVEGSASGVRALYVALTRATQRLDIVGTSRRWYH